MSRVSGCRTEVRGDSGAQGEPQTVDRWMVECNDGGVAVYLVMSAAHMLSLLSTVDGYAARLIDLV